MACDEDGGVCQASGSAPSRPKWRHLSYKEGKINADLYGGEYVADEFQRRFDGPVEDHDWDVLWVSQLQVRDVKECSAGASTGVQLLHGKELRQKTLEEKPKDWVVAQEYLSRPYLGFGGSKFHLRVYVL